MNKDKTKKSKVSPLVGAGLGTVAGGPVGAVAGASIARGVNKERDRYAKKGARSHLGKVGHDAKLGAKSLGLGSALAGGLAGAALGSTIPVKKKGFLGLGRNKKAENQQRLKNTLSGAGLGALGYGTSGAIKGAGTGALVGATRGFVQENKSKNKKMKNYKSSTKIIDFAFGIPAKPKKKRQIITESAKKGLSLGSKTGLNVGLLGGAISGAINTKSSNPRTKLIGAMIGGSMGGLVGTVGGGAAGLATGTGIGITKSLKKKKLLIEKLKNKKMKNYNYTVENFADFASRWKKTLSPDSVAQGKATGQLLAQNRKDVKKEIYTQSQTNKDLAEGIKKGKEASVAGKDALLKKAASSNRTMRPTTARRNIKVARPSNQLSPKSAQSFKQGAQNQATNAKNARLRNAANTFKNERVKVDPNAFNDVFNKPPKAPKSSGGFSGKGLGDDAFKGFAGNATKKVGRSMLGKKLLVGAGLAGGLYAAKKLGEKRRQSKQNPGLLSKLTKGRLNIK